jgi:hypothetical protein
VRLHDHPVLGEVLGVIALLLEGFEVREVLHAGAPAEVSEAVESEVEPFEEAVLTTPQTPT